MRSAARESSRPTRCSLSRPSTRTGFASDGDRVLDERFTHLDLSLEQPAQLTHSLCRQLTWRSSSHQDSRDRPRGIKDRWDKKAEYRPCVMWSRSTEHQQQLPLALPPGRRRRRPALPTKGENGLLHPLQEALCPWRVTTLVYSSGADPLYVHQGAFRLPERVRPLRRGQLRSGFAVILQRCTAAARVFQCSFARIQLPPTGLARYSARRRHPASAPPEGSRVSSLRPLAVLCGSGGSCIRVAF